jgi:hypothetical protein
MFDCVMLLMQKSAWIAGSESQWKQPNNLAVRKYQAFQLPFHLIPCWPMIRRRNE